MLIDIGLVLGAMTLTYFGTRDIGLPSPGPVSVLVGVLLAWWRLRAHGESWRSIGLTKPAGFLRTALTVVGLYVAVIAGAAIIVSTLGRLFGWPPQDFSNFAGIRGDPVQLARILAIAWTAAAIGEELLFRGFLLTRIEKLIGSGKAAAVGAVLAQALLFGAGHVYLGIRGAVTATLVGLIFGTWYAWRRELVPLMIAHALTDTISLVALYAGVVPASG